MLCMDVMHIECLLRQFSPSLFCRSERVKGNQDAKHVCLIHDVCFCVTVCEPAGSCYQKASSLLILIVDLNVFPFLLYSKRLAAEEREEQILEKTCNKIK